MSGRGKNDPRAQPRAEVAPEPNHYGPGYLPEGQAVDVSFNYVVHRWDAPDPDLKRKPAFPRFWLAHDTEGLRPAFRDALFPFQSFYPIGAAATEEAVAEYEREQEAIHASIDQFMAYVYSEDAWDFHHSIVWGLPDGGLSVTRLGNVQPPLPVVVDCPF